MPANRKPKSLAKDLQALKKQNALLKKQVQELADERDSYLQVLHAWAKRKMTRAAVKKAMGGEKVEGSLMTFIAEVKKEK